MKLHIKKTVIDINKDWRKHWRKHWRKLDSYESYYKMFFDIRKWTFNQFYPGI